MTSSARTCAATARWRWRRQLRLAKLEGDEGPAAPQRAVTESLIDAGRARRARQRVFRRFRFRRGAGPARVPETAEARRAAELRALEDALDALDDLEGLDADGLAGGALGARAREALTRMVRDLEREIRDRGRWDTHESGVETRDVLENGLRRADMGERSGARRPEERRRASMAIPAAERARVVAGVDVRKARLTGRPGTWRSCRSREGRRPFIERS